MSLAHIASREAQVQFLLGLQHNFCRAERITGGCIVESVGAQEDINVVRVVSALPKSVTAHYSHWKADGL
tara:strand:+ start:615 stop:824 length:210 start_codon:yes stop_codon:yes gene_type:complete